MRVAFFFTTFVVSSLSLGCAGPLDPVPEKAEPEPSKQAADPEAQRAERPSIEEIARPGGQIVDTDTSPEAPPGMRTIPPGCAMECTPCEGSNCPDERCEIVCDRPPVRQCSAHSDCQLFSNYCGGCECNAIGVDERSPTCPSSELVRCFADPCMDQRAVCVDGTCTTVIE